MEKGWSQRIGEFAASLRLADLPPEVIERARLIVLHNVGVALAGWGGPLPMVSLSLGFPTTARGARVLVDGRPLCPPDAAFANACLMHIRTQDDFYSGANAHLGAVIIPAVLAVAEHTGAQGGEIIAAIVAGYEVMAGLGEGFSEKVVPKGFRPTGIFGPMGAAAAVGRLLGLSSERLGHAIAISASLAGGLTQSWIEGTPEWDVEVGMASRNGIMAALLSAEGMPGASLALEGPRGFYHAFVGEEASLDEKRLRLGKRWRILENTFKRFPISGISQVPTRAALSLRQKHGLKPESIAAVELTVNDFERRYPGVDAPGPFGGQGAALMSLQYCLATALQKGTILWRDLFEVEDKVRLNLAARIQVRGEANRTPLSCRLVIKTTDGRTLEESRDAAAGLHLSREEATALIRSLIPEMPIEPQQVEQLIVEALRIDQARSVKPLIDCCIKR